MNRLPACLALALPLSLCAPARAQDAAAPQALERVVIGALHYDNAVGSSDAASQGVIRAELLKVRPALRPGEVLEYVPGVIVTQHSGDGKANQYFLRGFNLDHGTDFATSVAGMPVNMPTHAHGQGYSDLNFLLPELVDRIEYRKGPYFVRNGDFASAGSADIAYTTRLAAPLAVLTTGQDGYRRGLVAGSTTLAGGPQLLGAVELMRDDGPWRVPEGLSKSNLALGLSGGDRAQGWSAWLLSYRAHWTATDQVPERLLDAGTLGRFDSLDPSDGGRTERHSVSAEWHQRDDSGATRLAAYLIDYRLQLFSNFSYALERPATGDQFSQRDVRRVLGLSAERSVEHEAWGLPVRSEFGLQLRGDRARVGLFDTQARQLLTTTRDDQVRLAALSLFGQSQVELSPKWRAVFGLRADHVDDRVDSLTLAANSGQRQATQLSPKFSLIAGPWARTEFFVNAGRGLHSNDARGTTARVDPRSGEAVEAVPALVASRGMELGLRSEWLPGLQTSLALWRLNFDSELVYVGDAGSTEAQHASRRFGLEWNNRWAANGWLTLDADLAWTHARFADGTNRYIPNSVDQVASVGVSVHDLGPWSASLNWRFLGAGPLVDDNSVRSRVNATTNLRLTRQLPALVGQHAELSLDVFNLFDRRVNDIEYVYDSRVAGEPAAVSDRHVHPAQPRSLRLTLRLAF